MGRVLAAAYQLPRRMRFNQTSFGQVWREILLSETLDRKFSGVFGSEAAADHHVKVRLIHCWKTGRATMAT